jgi:hypothetical protein
VVRKDPDSHPRSDGEKSALDRVRQYTPEALLIAIDIPGGTRNFLRKNFHVAGLKEPANGLWRIEVDVPHGVENKVSWQAQRILQWHLDEDVSRHSTGFGQQTARVLYVFNHMRQDDKVESIVGIRDRISVKQLALPKATNSLLAYGFYSGAGYFERVKL